MMKDEDEHPANMDNAENPSPDTATQNEEINAVSDEAITKSSTRKEEASTNSVSADSDSKSMQSSSGGLGEARGLEGEFKSLAIGETDTNSHETVKAEGDANSTTVQVGKQPRRVLHFSDGQLEEYSTDEDEDNGHKETESTSKAVETHKMTWPKYLLYATMLAGSKSLKACDYVGEGLANFFGITTPKYQFEISEYEKMKKEEEEEKKKQDLEMRGWTEAEGPQPNVVTAEQLASGDASAATAQPQRF